MTMLDYTKEYLGILIYPLRDEMIDEQARVLLEKHYLLEHETSPQEAFARACVAYCYGDLEFAQRIYNYVSQGWFMFSSPILSNAPIPEDPPKSLPISCFLSYVPDNLKGLIDHSTEIRWLSVKGGGVGGHWSDIRAVSDKSPGPIPFLHTIDSDMIAYKQGKTRKGSYAAYLDIDHPDIIEFISMRLPTRDSNRANLNLHHGVNIPDKFMCAVRDNLDWDLLDPHTKIPRETISARELWYTILETRYRTGEPYLNFIDTVNNSLQPAQKEKGYKVKGSNLCNEIHLYTNEDRTAVCCLSSLNLEKYDEWVNTKLVKDMIRFLDNVLQFFIDNAPDDIHKAVYSAKMERSLGLGVMGFHSYLQKHNIPFDSDDAFRVNREIISQIKTEADEATIELAKIRGEPADMVGTGKRNAHLLAIAPNANSSTLLSTSPSIEPWKANAFTSRTRIGSFLVKNKYLEKVIDKYDRNTKEIWSSIINNKGSVQHLDFLTKAEKEVFKTAIEIDQIKLVKMAGERQKYICQGQSLNLFFPPKVRKSVLNAVHYTAWLYGVKGLYYLRTEASSNADKIGEKVERKQLDTPNKEQSDDDCINCQG